MSGGTRQTMDETPSQPTHGPGADPAGPGNLPVSLVVSALIGITATILWGFAGTWALTSLIPGFIVGSTLAHLVRALRKVHDLRPGVLALGVFLGGTAAALSLAVQAAATSPVEQIIERRVFISAPKEIVWDWIERAEQRVAWSVLVSDVEPIGRGERETRGSRFRATLNLDGATMTGEHEVLEHETGEKVAWRVHFPTGVRIEQFVQRLTLAETGEQTAVTYTISYRVPSVLGRLFNNIRVRDMFDEAAQLSLAALTEKASE